MSGDLETIEIAPADFFALLKADPRDIMPNHDAPDVTVWQTVHGRIPFGESRPGWKNPEGPVSYHLHKPGSL